MKMVANIIRKCMRRKSISKMDKMSEREKENRKDYIENLMKVACF